MAEGNFLTCILCRGIPGAGKSFWAKAEVAKDPFNWIRISNDEIRAMINNSVFSHSCEKLVTETRNFLIKESLKNNKNVIIDNLNLNKIHFQTVCKITRNLNIDIEVIEKPFYIDVETAIERESNRGGSAKVGEEVIRKWWETSGKEQFKHYIPKHEIFRREEIKPLIQDKSLIHVVVCDVDNTVAEITHRSPYDASTCLNDIPISHAVEMIKLCYKNGYKIIFLSGRQDKFKDLTSQWLDKHIGVPYDLFMRKTGDLRKDAIIKEEIYRNNIEGKYYTQFIFDDRLQCVDMWYKLNLPIFRVNDPTSDF
jgi:predicted kinase